MQAPQPGPALQRPGILGTAPADRDDRGLDRGVVHHRRKRVDEALTLFGAKYTTILTPAATEPRTSMSSITSPSASAPVPGSCCPFDADRTHARRHQPEALEVGVEIGLAEPTPSSRIAAVCLSGARTAATPAPRTLRRRLAPCRAMTRLAVPGRHLSPRGRTRRQTSARRRYPRPSPGGVRKLPPRQRPPLRRGSTAFLIDPVESPCGTMSPRLGLSRTRLRPHAGTAQRYGSTGALS